MQSKEHGNLESELKIQSSAQLQAKIDLDASSGDYNVIKRELFDNDDWTLEFEGMRPTVDEYWDTPDFLMHKSGSSFRVRYVKDGVTVEVKEPVDVFEKSSLYNRNEYPTSLDRIQLNEAFSSKFIEIRKKYCPHTVDSNFEFKFRLQNARRVWIARKGDAELELVLDLFSYSTPYGLQTTPLFNEIEIEAKNESGRNELLKLSKRVDSSRDMTKSESSKYSKGVNALKLERNDAVNRLVHWSKTPEGTFCLVLVALLSLLTGIIGIVIAFII